MSFALAGLALSILIAQDVTRPQTLAPAADVVALPKIFHIAGVPKLARDARADLTLTDTNLVLTYKKDQQLVVPYGRLRYLELLAGERHHEAGTAGAAAAAGIAGALLILKKRNVDTLIFEYENERGGRMGLVLQVPEKQGTVCADWLDRFGVVVKRP